MKIVKTEIYRFSIGMKPFAIATGIMNYAQNVFIRIYTDQDLYGVGECSAFPVIVGETQETCITLARDFARIWKDKDPLNIPERIKELDDFIAHNSTIKSAFDMALYDISAKAANQPLYQFLGGRKRPVETDITLGIDDAGTMAELAEKYAQSGASVLKIKLGKAIDEDMERLRRISNAVGPDFPLRIDANQGWTFDEASEILGSIGNLNIQFCEQPMRSWYDDLLPELRQISPVKIMADESCFNHHDARKLIKAQACDFINIKFAKSGGITEALKIYETAASEGIDCMIGGMLESRIALSANLHFAYACPEICFFDLDTCLIGHLEDPADCGVVYNGYSLSVGDQPGIGADAKESFLRNCEKWTI